MIRSDTFLLRNVAGSWVVVPVGDAAIQFAGMLTLNETGRVLWELLEQAQTTQSLAQALVQRYEVTLDQATADVEAFLEPLLKVGAVQR